MATKKKTPAAKKIEAELPSGETVVAEALPEGTEITPENAGVVVDSNGVEHVGEIPADAALPEGETVTDNGELLSADGKALDEPGKAKAEDAPVEPVEEVTNATPKKARAKSKKPKTAKLKGPIQADAEELAEAIEPVQYEKDFVLLKRDWYGANNADHETNFNFLKREALAQGWRPSGDPRYVGEEDHVDGKSVVLHYAVEVVPAS